MVIQQFEFKTIKSTFLIILNFLFQIQNTTSINIFKLFKTTTNNPSSILSKISYNQVIFLSARACDKLTSGSQGQKYPSKIISKPNILKQFGFN